MSMKLQMTNTATSAELESALAHVLSAPSSGTVQVLCVRPAHNLRVFPERIHLSREKGIAGDFEMQSPWLTRQDGSPDPRIQVSILPLRVLDLIWRDREAVVYPGDTIIADLDMTERNLPAGARIKVGSACLEVSDLRNDGCAKWRARYGRDAYEWVRAEEHHSLRLRGILCSVVSDGEIAIGDLITRI
jgi:hypothetical protein